MGGSMDKEKKNLAKYDSKEYFLLFFDLKLTNSLAKLGIETKNMTHLVST